MLTVGCVLSTTANGNPYGDPPKSGWRSVVAACIDCSQVALWASTGSLEMSVFQVSSAGRTAQVVPGTGASTAARPGGAEPLPVGVAAQVAASNATAAPAIADRRIPC